MSDIVEHAHEISADALIRLDYIRGMVSAIGVLLEAKDAEIARMALVKDSLTTELDLANERANKAEADLVELRQELRTQRAMNTSPAVLSSALALCSVTDKARMFVECFETPADGDYDSISTFKVEIPADGYPRQWAVHAAPAVLAELGAAMATVRGMVGHE